MQDCCHGALHVVFRHLTPYITSCPRVSQHVYVSALVINDGKNYVSLESRGLHSRSAV